jgi:actin-related protein 5
MEENINKLIFNINWDNKNPIFETSNFTGVGNNMTQDKNVGIVIDNGSYECRAGWSICEEPNLRFKNFVAKPKVQNKNQPHVFLVGNEILSYEQGKLNRKSPFDKNIVTHFGTQEHVLDYIFTNLKLTDNSVNHPVVFTEPFCNLNWTRKNLSEMFFELYSVPSLLYGVDSMFSLHNNQPMSEDMNCLLISSSFQTTHIIPILNGRVVADKARRINVGGYNINELMTKTLHLKYPDLRMRFTNEVIQEIQEKYTECAKSYHKQLDLLENVFKIDQDKLREEEKIRMFGSLEMYEKAYVEELGAKRRMEGKYKHLLPYRNMIDYENRSITLHEDEEVTRDLFFLEWPTCSSEITDDDMRKKQELRKEQSKRLREMMQKKREDNIKILEKELEELEVVSLLKDKDQFQFEEALLAKGYATNEELQKRINKIFIKINFGKEAKEEERFDEEKRWPLLSMPDEDLTDEQVKMKRIQKMQRNAYITRVEKREQLKMEKEKVDQLKREDPQNYLISLYKKKKELLDRLENYKQIRKDLSNRHSKVNLRRMMVLANLGGDDSKPTKKKDNANDDFGINDEDWEVYRGISRHNLSEDEEEDQQQLNDVEAQIIDMDPSYLRYNDTLSDNVLSGRYLFLGIDQFRGPELLFQPYMIGIEQAGLTEIILSIFKSMSYEEQKALAGNIFITGGCANIKNLDERIRLDLRKNLHCDIQINVRKVSTCD